MELSKSQINSAVKRALEEDLGQGDVTTDTLIQSDLKAEGSILARENGILAGIAVAQAVFQQVDPSIQFDEVIADGADVNRSDVIGRIQGKAAGILKGERVALNFLQHLSGIATIAQRYVQAVSGTKAKILDTRKTIPGLRVLEKYAVRVGGGQNHRQNLGDGVLIKDNHLAALSNAGVDLGEVLKRARANVSHTLKIEVEVQAVDQALEAVESGADIILLDNMSPDEMSKAVNLVNGKALLEASGGITLETTRAVAETGVDLISVGALTHSVKALDISLEIKFI